MNDELIAYYVNLLIIQYKNRNNAKGTIAAIVRSLMIYEIMRSVENAYSIEGAIGDQLDILAKYVGANRIVSQIDLERVYLSIVKYYSPEPYTAIGFVRYPQLTLPDAQFLRYKSKSSLQLTDIELRFVIKLKIFQDNSNHTTYEIDQYLNEFFAGEVIFTDNFNMTITYIFSTSIQRVVEIALNEGSIPKPAAVSLTISFVDDLNNIFSLLKYTADTPADFSQGLLRYSDDPFGSFLRY